jgi:hypothetical protein
MVAGGNSIHSEIRENTCIHNGRSPRLSERQGAIFLYTWNGGKLDGVEIVDNTVIWDPPVRAPGFSIDRGVHGESAQSFCGQHNRCRISIVRFIRIGHAVFRQPLLCAEENSSAAAVSGRVEPQFRCAAWGRPSSSVESDPAANNPDELCGCLEELLRKTAGADLRRSAPEPAIEQPESKSAPGGVHLLAGRWVLGAVLAPPGDPEAEESRGQLVLIESMMHQFADVGLGSIVVPTRSMTRNELEQWRTNWNFKPAVEIDATNASGLRKASNSADLLLISPSGQVAASWHYPVSPADVWLQIQSHLGTPAGTQQMPACQRPGIR